MGGCFSSDDPIQPNNQIQNRSQGNQQMNTQAQNNYQGQQMQQPQYGQNQNYGQQMQPQYGQNFGQGQQMHPPQHGQNQNYGQFQMQPQGAQAGYQFAAGQTQVAGVHIFQRHFPPQYSSICLNKSIIDEIDERCKKIFQVFENEPGYGWTRIGQFNQIILQGGPKLFQNRISPLDVNQGGFGTCYLLAAFAALAEWEPRVRKLFNSDQPNPDGSYDVNLYCGGYRQRINVDDYFPSKENGKSLVGARSLNGTIWHIVLEKAYAKFYGSYADISGGGGFKGFSSDALRDLTGAPSQKYWIEGTVDAWEKINEGNQKNYVMTAAAKDRDFISVGLVGFHVYTLLGTATVTNQNGQECRIVQMRNPWGEFEWNGDWSDKSSCWTNEWKQKLNVKPNDDGLFWMSFQDFQQYFDNFSVCHYNENYSFSQSEPLKFEKDGDYKFIKIKIFNTGNYTFSCALKPQGMLTSKQIKKRKYEGIRFQLIQLLNGKDFEGECEHIKICSSYGDPPLNTYEIQLDDLQEGEYLALIDPDISKFNNSELPMILNSYGPGNVAFQDVTSEFIKNGYGLQDFVEGIYYSLFQNCPDKFNEGTISDNNELPETIKFWEYGDFDGYGIYFLDNSDEQITITQKIKWNITEGYVLPPTKNDTDPYKLNGVDMEISCKPQYVNFILVRTNLQEGDEDMEETDFVLN